MKNAPFYEVTEIRDLRDMLRQGVRRFGDRTAFLIKDPRAVRLDQQPGEPKKEKSQPYLPISYKQFARDVDA
ncbi:MAG: hypothetical protein GX173_11315, partial [Ruminococcaceae bacterium]|nr:hypothetical protein [Oscillospiraceae bacterium]